MINKDFCELLEYKITNAFENSADAELKAYWCDGILLPTFDFQYSSKYVNDNRQVTFSAFIGVDGQDEYNVSLLFGKKSLSKYARGLDISDCIPDFIESESFKIDKLKKRVWIQLL